MSSIGEISVAFFFCGPRLYSGVHLQNALLTQLAVTH